MNKERTAFLYRVIREQFLVIEFTKETRKKLLAIAKQVEAEMRAAGLGYHFPLLFGDDTKKIWTLRKAGLGFIGQFAR